MAALRIPTSVAPARVSRRRTRRLWLVVGVLVALFMLFEVGIRHVPPDGMTVTYNYKYSVNAVIGTRTYIAPKDQQTIHDTYAAFNAAPVMHVTVGEFAGCSLVPYPSQVEFTWHGVPVESWTSLGCPNYESAGGISDNLIIGDQQVFHEPPYITFPLPPPRSG